MNVEYVVGPVLVALIGFAGVLVQVRKIHTEVKSPNGVKTGDQIYQLHKDVLDLRVNQIELAESVKVNAEAARDAIDAATARAADIAVAVEEHNEQDAVRFAQLFDAVGIQIEV